MDRIFDREEIKYICSEIKKILKDCKKEMKAMAKQAEKAKSAMDSVPDYAKESRVTVEADALIRAINDIDFDTIYKKLDDCKDRACSQIPSADKTYAKETQRLKQEVDNIKKAAQSMQEFLISTPLNIPPESFGQKLEAASLTWNEILEDAELSLHKLLMNIKGEDTKSVWYSVDPVNLSTGNFIYNRTDLEIGSGEPFALRRFYNAVNHRKGVFGRDWNHNYEIRLETDKKEKVLLSEDGREERFLLTLAGGYAPVYQDSGALEQAGEGYVYTTREQKKYVFDGRGYCTGQETLHGGRLFLAYLDTESGRVLHRISKETGEYFELSYDGEGYLHKVSDHTGRSITYEMEGEFLAGVSTPAGGWYRYGYTREGKLESVKNPEGAVIVENTFDGQMRTIKQQFPDGGAMLYTYDDETGETILTERNGSQVTYVHDGKFRDIRHVYSDGEERFAYNHRNQRTEFVDKLGHKTTYAYDGNGNRTGIINALGSRMDLEYGDGNRLHSVSIDGRRKVHNVYDEAGHLIKTKDAEGNTYQFRYQENGLVEQIIQPDEGVVKFERDSRGNITCLTEPDGVAYRFEYDDLNQVTGTVDGNGNKTSYLYDLGGNIIQVTNPSGDSRSYTYDAGGKVIRVEDFDGGTTLREYNTLGRPCKVIDRMGRATILSYDSMWNLARVTQPDGARTTFIYNEQNRLSRIRNAYGDVVRYSYDAVGNRTGVTDELGHKTTFSYDALGRLREVRIPEGGCTKYDYDAEGRVTRVEDALGNEVTLAYDGNGKLVRETTPLGESRSYAYTCMGQLAAVTDETGQTTSYTYNKGGRLLQVAYPEGTRASYTYDGNGNIRTYTNPKGHVMTYTYDALDQVVRIEGSGGERKDYAYDSMGNVISMTDGRGAATRYEYTLSGKLAKVTDPLGNTTTCRYDDRDRLLEICQHGEGPDDDLEWVREGNRENTRVTRYEHDMLGRLLKVTDGMGQTETYEYDKKGQLLAKVDKDGYLTRYGHTASGEVDHIQYADGREVKLSYNPIRQLQEIEDWLGSTVLTQDAMGRVEKVTWPDQEEVSYTYGARGERTGITYPGGEEAIYEYDSHTRLRCLHQSGETIRYSYDATGFLTGKYFPNGVETSYEYDDKGQLLTLRHSDREGILDEYRYGYDQTGNRISLTKNRRGLEGESGTYRYAYDLLGRLTEITRDGMQQTAYAYDAFGNRTGMIQDGMRTEYEYNAINQLTAERNNRSDVAYLYDKRGNVSRITENGTDTYRYVYGSTGRLEECTGPEGQLTRYRYDGLGNRIGKSVEAADRLPGHVRETWYRTDITRPYDNLLQKTEGGDSQAYFWDTGVVALRDEKDPAGLQYYLKDEMGSPIRLLHGDGAVKESHGYGAFGAELHHRGGSCQSFGYTGYQQDAESGTYYAQARQYHPGTGRFLSHDMVPGRPSAPQTLNRYSYCYNSPIVLVDRDGMFPALSRIGEDIGGTLSDWGDAFAAGIDHVAEAVSGTVGQVGSQVVDWGNQNPAVRDMVLDTVKPAAKAACKYMPDLLGITHATQQGYLDGVLEKFDFHKDNAGIYHTSPDCWQQYLGYNDLYDWVFDAGTSMKSKKYEVVTGNGEQYCIWMWKGDYLNLGAGAETGIYKGGEPHWETAVDDALPMLLALYDKDGNTIFVYDPEDLQWWITGFDPMLQSVKQKDLVVIGSIDFSLYPELWKAYCQEYGRNTEWCFDMENNKAYYKW